MTTRKDIEEAVLIAATETGVRDGRGAIPLCFAPSAKKKARIWMKKEDDFICENHGRISEAQIGKQLGRSLIAVRLRIKRDLHLASMSKDPGVLSAEQIANGLGLDGKSVHLLMDSGRMPCRRLPSVRIMRVIDRRSLMIWLLNFENWLYFKPDRIGAFFRKGKRGYGENYDFVFWENARMVMLKACRKCKDRWLTPGQVVEFLKIKPTATPRRKLYDRIPGVRYVNAAIHKGTIKAKRWGNWWIRKSDLPKRGKTINFKGEIVDFKI